MTMTDFDNVGKLFIGGLSWETTKENLHNYFSKFGEVTDSIVMKNHETGRSRGFGFVTFKDPDCVLKVLQAVPHEINGRRIDAKECTPRSMQKNKRQASQCKVFLGGLPPDVTEAAIRNAMSKFGKVTHVMIMIDQETKKCRGFGFLSYESEESIEQACAARYVNINGKQVECKQVEQRDNVRRQGAQQYNMNSYSQNSPARSPAYASLGSSAYPSSFNPPAPHSYNFQGGSAYNYQSYGYTSGQASSTPNSLPYAAMPPMQYSQSYFPNYGTGGYNYSQAPPPTSSYTQSVTAQTAAAAPAVNTNMPTGTYGTSAYPQNPSSYGPSKVYVGNESKSYGDNGTNSSNHGGIQTAKVQGYHPYQR